MDSIKFWYVIFTLATLVPALVGMISRRDAFDPRLFLVVYWFSYSSQLTSYFLASEMRETIIVPHIVPVLICASVSSLVFSLVAAATLKKTSTLFESQIEQNIATVCRDFALIVMFCSSLLILSYALSVGGFDFQKSVHRDSRSETETMLYRLVVVATMISSMLTLSLDSQCYKFGRSRLKYILGLVGCQMTWCWLMSERNVVLILVLIAAAYSGKGVRGIRIAAFAAACMMALFVQLERRSNNQGVVLDSNAIRAYASTKLLPKMSGSLTVFTNVVDIVPEHHDYFAGSSYLYSLGTFLPGDPFKAREKAIGSWFPRNYYYRNNAGVDFAIDAEGYINFGWLGPPFVFGGMALFLSLIYNQRRRFGVASIVYPVYVLVFCAAVRTNSQATFKMLVGSTVVCLMLIFVASKLVQEHYRHQTAPSPPAT